MRSLIALFVFLPALASADYSQCILENMTGVGSDVAAEEIKKACLIKYPVDKQSVAQEGILEEVVVETSDVAPEEETTASSLESPSPPESKSESEQQSSSCDLTTLDDEYLDEIRDFKDRNKKNSSDVANTPSQRLLDETLARLTSASPGLCVKYTINVFDNADSGIISHLDGSLYLSSAMVIRVADLNTLASIIAGNIANVEFVRSHEPSESVGNEQQGKSSRLKEFSKVSVGTIVGLSGSLSGAYDRYKAAGEAVDLALDKDPELQGEILRIKQSLLTKAGFSSSAPEELIDINSKSEVDASAKNPKVLRENLELANKVARRLVRSGKPVLALRTLKAYSGFERSNGEHRLTRGLAFQKADNKKAEPNVRMWGFDFGFYTYDEALSQKSITKTQEQNHSRAVQEFSLYLDSLEAPLPEALFQRAQSYQVLGNVRLAARDLVLFVRATRDNSGKNSMIAMQQLRRIREALRDG